MRKIRFLHASDVHIGKDRFGNGFGVRDFDAALTALIDYAVNHEVSFVAISGDLFDKPQPEPEHLLWTEKPLMRLREASIPLIAIDGNHDRYAYSNRGSWVQYLGNRGLLRYLTMRGTEEEVLNPWTEVKGWGAFTDVDDVRIYGVGYWGAGTGPRIKRFAPKIKPQAFTVLLLHAGIMGISAEFGGVTKEDLDPLRVLVDYIALGHQHRTFDFDNWIYNPGSLTHAYLDEWRYRERGFYEVTADLNERTHHAEFIPVPSREGHLEKIDVSGMATVEEAGRRVLEAYANLSPDQDSVVRLTVEGHAQFNPMEFDVNQVKKRCLEVLPVGHLEIVADLVSPGGGEDVNYYESISRERLEREEAAALLREIGIGKDVIEELSRLTLNLQKGVSQGEDQEDLFSQVRAFVLKRHAHS